MHTFLIEGIFSLLRSFALLLNFHERTSIVYNPKEEIFFKHTDTRFRMIVRAIYTENLYPYEKPTPLRRS